MTAQIKDGSWNGKALFKDLDFYNFKAETASGEKQLIIKLGKKASDYIQMQYFENMRFHDVESKALTYFFEPPKSWINPADCGNFACTGPKNTAMHFKGTEWLGTSVPPVEGIGADF